MKKDEFEQYKAMSAEQMLEVLKQKYYDDPDAMEIIFHAEKDLSYIQSELYRGTQTPQQYMLHLAAFLYDWY